MDKIGQSFHDHDFESFLCCVVQVVQVSWGLNRDIVLCNRSLWKKEESRVNEISSGFLDTLFPKCNYLA